MKRLQVLVMTLLMALLAGCSAEERSAADLAEVREPLISPCAIGGASGIADTTYITRVMVDGDRLEIDNLDPIARVRDTSYVIFRDVHWAPFHPTNGTTWQAQSDAYPLRQVTFKGPGCELSFPDKHCLFLRGDYRVDDIHVNQLQNTEVFLFDRPASPLSTASYPSFGQYTADFGYGITRIEGLGLNPSNTLRVSGITTSGGHHVVSTKDWKFTTPGCP